MKIFNTFHGGLWFIHGALRDSCSVGNNGFEGLRSYWFKHSKVRQAKSFGRGISLTVQTREPGTD